MTKQVSVRLGELQLRIMQVLWQARLPVAVAEVQKRLDGAPWLTPP